MFGCRKKGNEKKKKKKNIGKNKLKSKNQINQCLKKKVKLETQKCKKP